MTLAERKRQLRGAVALAVTALHQDERDRAHRSIAALLCSLDAYRASQQLLAYSPLADEVDVAGVIDDAAREGKALFLPVASASGSLSYRRWLRGGHLVRSTLGVLEPVDGDPPSAVPSIVLVPGRAFAVDGCRVGRGGGFYDRALTVLSRLGTTVGIAYSGQVFAHVPHGSGDERVDVVVSELGVGEKAMPAAVNATGGHADE